MSKKYNLGSNFECNSQFAKLDYEPREYVTYQKLNLFKLS
jgi:hypothetical protein